MHHEVVGSIFLEVTGVLNIAVATRGDRYNFGDFLMLVLGSGLIALSHLT